MGLLGPTLGDSFSSVAVYSLAHYGRLPKNLGRWL